MNELGPFKIFDLRGWGQNGGWGQNRGQILIGNEYIYYHKKNHGSIFKNEWVIAF